MAERPKVVVTNPVFPETRALLEEHATVVVNPAREPWPHEEVRQRCRDADGLLAFMNDRIDTAFLAACPRLRVIGAALKGFDNIDVEAATNAGVWLTIVPDLLTVPTAELAIGLMLALGRNIVAGNESIKKHGFHGWRAELYGAGLAGATVGIVGFGLVGRAIAERLVGFQCRLLAYDQSASEALANALAVCHDDKFRRRDRQLRLRRARFAVDHRHKTHFQFEDHREHEAGRKAGESGSRIAGRRRRRGGRHRSRAAFGLCRGRVRVRGLGDRGSADAHRSTAHSRIGANRFHPAYRVRRH